MQVDGVEPDHCEDTCKERRDLQLRTEKSCDDAGNTSCRTCSKDRDEGRILCHEHGGGNASTEGKAPLDGQIRNVQNTICQIDAQRIESPQDALCSCCDDQIHNVTPYISEKKRTRCVPAPLSSSIVYSAMTAPCSMSSGMVSPIFSAFFLLITSMSSCAVSIGISAGLRLPSRMSAAIAPVCTPSL